MQKNMPQIRFYPNEEFKEIEINESLQFRYAISNKGRLISFTDDIQNGRLLKGGLSDGYPTFRFKVKQDDKIVNNMALTCSSDVLDKAHEDDAVLPPNTQAEESGLAQKVFEGIEGTKDATSVEDGGATQPPVNATSSNQPLHKDPPEPGISLHSSGSKADKPTLKDPPSNILGQTSPKGSKKEKKKSSDKLHESLTDEELKRKPPEDPYVPLTDEQLEDFFNELQKNPQNYRGGKHLRNFPDIEPNTTQTETDEDSDDPPHDPGAASVPGTPEASLQDSESEDAYEPDDVVGVDPKGSGRKKRIQ